MTKLYSFFLITNLLFMHFTVWNKMYMYLACGWPSSFEFVSLNNFIVIKQNFDRIDRLRLKIVIPGCKNSNFCSLKLPIHTVHVP